MVSQLGCALCAVPIPAEPIMPALVCLFTSPVVDVHPPPKSLLVLELEPRVLSSPLSFLHITCKTFLSSGSCAEYHNHAPSSSQGSWSLTAGGPGSCLHQVPALPAGAEMGFLALLWCFVTRLCHEAPAHFQVSQINRNACSELKWNSLAVKSLSLQGKCCQGVLELSHHHRGKFEPFWWSEVCSSELGDSL